MADAIISSVALTVEELATFIQRLPLGPSSSSVPNRNIVKIEEDIKRLSRALVRIRARLNDAEEMEIGDKYVHHWLRELEGVAYVAEDVIDELLYEKLRLQSEGSGLPLKGHAEEVTDATAHHMGELFLQVSDSSSSSHEHEIIGFLHDVEQRIEEINLRFHDISEHRVALRLEESDGQRQVGLEIPARQPTSSLMEEPHIVGREEDLKTVKKFLLSDAESSRSNNIPVMAIVGMGGLGKTTLAQHAYNDEEVSKQFDLKSWVCVSEDFDLVRLTRAMIESFTGEACHLSQLDPLQIKLKQKLAGKIFLLVLDDIWEQDLEHIWDRLKAPLFGGSRGSKIIITTRIEEASRIVRAVSTYHLPCLEDEDCLQLFNQRAFEGRDPSLHPKLMAMGKEISKKCRGIPLVAKILGGQLCWEDNEQKWKDILEGNIWDIDKKGIMPVLRLSYNHLPAYLRKCFGYCSLFPKDYKLDKSELVHMWMAQGYIQARGTRLMEDIGNEYFDYLLQRSFFQCSPNPEIFYMHDLIHDLARLVSRGECYSLEDGKPSSNLEGGVRHIAIISGRDFRRGVLSMRFVDQLRSFLFIGTVWPSCRMKLPNDVFSRMKHLRVLHLSCIDNELSLDFIDYLKHLRYLALELYYVKELPESVGTLYHLQTLNLYGCSHLKYLPSSISQLLNLRHLICSESFAYPAGIEKLTNLQTLPDFVVSSEYGPPKLGVLKDLNQIRSLRISGLNNLTDVCESKKACLGKKEHLRDLHLEWDDRPPFPFDDEVLGILRPNHKLEWLRIAGFTGRSVPSWLGDESFSNMVIVELTGCREWTSLPPLGRLLSLKHLSILSAEKVKYIGRKFFSGGFPRLETLELGEMPNWKSWCGARKGECPRLRQLVVFLCNGLTSLSLINLDALQVLETKKCSKFEFSSHTLQVGQLPSLQRIHVQEIPGATHIRGNYGGGFLEALYLFEVRQWPAAAEGDYSCLHQLELKNCGELTSLPLCDLNALEVLEMDDCLRLRFSKEDLLPARLKQLSIRGCPLLSLWCRRHTQQLVHIPALELEGVDTRHLMLVDVLGVDEDAGADLSALEDLQMLELGWYRHTDTEPEEVLKNLRPHTNLEELVIRGYAGSIFATWLGDPSFSNLVSVTLLRCSQCKLLPPLGQLPFLEELHVSGADRLQHVGDEFLGGGSSSGDKRSCAFPSLGRLEFIFMPIWEVWEGTEDGDLPSLQKLTIKYCSTLKALPHLPPQLRELEIEACGNLTLYPSLTHLLHLEVLRISGIPSLRELPKLPHNLNELVLEDLPEVAALDIPPVVASLTPEGCNNCPRLYFPTTERPPSGLQCMKLTSCPLLVPWCHTNLSRLGYINQIWVDGNRICPRKRKRPSGLTMEEIDGHYQSLKYFFSSNSTCIKSLEALLCESIITGKGCTLKNYLYSLSCR